MLCSSRLDKIHTFHSLVERGLEIQEVHLFLFFFSGVFSKYNNPVFDFSECRLGGVHWSEFTVGYRISNLVPREFLEYIMR